LLVRGFRDLWQVAARTRVPLLVVLGEQDRLVHIDTARRWERARPDATVVRLPLTGHVAMIEHPEAVADLLAEHWAERARSAASPAVDGNSGGDGAVLPAAPPSRRSPDRAAD
jgi:surfactin synthase thioesterase subunit